MYKEKRKKREEERREREEEEVKKERGIERKKPDGYLLWCLAIKRRNANQ